jgi:hypothetical protein
VCRFCAGESHESLSNNDTRKPKRLPLLEIASKLPVKSDKVRLHLPVKAKVGDTSETRSSAHDKGICDTSEFPTGNKDCRQPDAIVHDKAMHDFVDGEIGDADTSPYTDIVHAANHNIGGGGRGRPEVVNTSTPKTLEAWTANDFVTQKSLRSPIMLVDYDWQVFATVQADRMWKQLSKQELNKSEADWGRCLS